MDEPLQLNNYLVAFIDILGFGRKVLNAQDDKGLTEIRDKLEHLHDIFDKEPTEESAEYEARISKRYVLALSDALVVATAFESPLTEVMGVFDNLCSEIHTIGMNQAICCANGIFLRGGLSWGQFFFEGNILLSQAMVRAYKVESKRAMFPVITLDKLTYEFFENHTGNRCYVEETNPKNWLFRQYDTGNGEVLYHIDYVRIGVCMGAEEFTRADQEEWRRVPKEKRDSKREEIHKRNAKKFLLWHKEAIVRAMEENRGDDIVLPKYEWLKGYHNEVAAEKFSGDSDYII